MIATPRAREFDGSIAWPIALPMGIICGGPSSSLTFSLQLTVNVLCKIQWLLCYITFSSVFVDETTWECEKKETFDIFLFHFECEGGSISCAISWRVFACLRRPPSIRY